MTRESPFCKRDEIADSPTHLSRASWRDVSSFFVEKRTAAPKIRPGQTSAGAQNPQASHCGGSAGPDALGVGQLPRLGLRRQAYLVTEPFQALDQIVPEMLGVPLVKVIHSQVLVINVVFQHVIENHQQAVAYRDERPLLAPPCRQTAVLGV